MGEEDDKSKAGKAKKGGSMLTISAGHRVSSSKLIYNLSFFLYPKPKYKFNKLIKEFKKNSNKIKSILYC